MAGDEDVELAGGCGDKKRLDEWGGSGLSRTNSVGGERIRQAERQDVPTRTLFPRHRPRRASMKSRNHVTLTFLALISQLLSGAIADEKECTVHDCMNSYDLSPLRAE